MPLKTRSSGRPAQPRPPAPAAPFVPFDALAAFLERLGEYDESLIVGPVPGEPVYHYTSLEGLVGIVQNHDLWLTHSRYSNDEHEMAQGLLEARRVIRERLARARSAGRRAYLRALQDRFEPDDPLTGLPASTEGVYVCCFSFNDNLLSQWRGYGGEGAGVCLAFDPRRFAYATAPESPSPGLLRLWKVFYDPADQARIIDRAIAFAGEYRPRAPLAERAHLASACIHFFVPTFKNPDFREERECRLIFTPHPGADVPTRFRVGRELLVPYFRLADLLGGESPRLPLVGLRIGPGAHRHLNAESARLLLARHGYADVPVEISETPYRG